MRQDTELLLCEVIDKLDVLRNLIDNYCADEAWVTNEGYDQLIRGVDMVRGMVRKICENENVEDPTKRCATCGAEIKSLSFDSSSEPTGATWAYKDGSMITVCMKCLKRLGWVKDDDEEEVEDETN